MSYNFWENDATQNFKIQIYHGLYKEIKTLKNENIGKNKIPDNFWVEKSHPINTSVPPMSFRGQKFILKNLTQKITKFCEFMCYQAINSNSLKKNLQT